MKLPRVSFFLRAGFSALLLALVLHKIQWVRLADVLVRSRWELAGAAFLLLPFWILLLSLRWRVFLRQQQLILPLRPVVMTVWAGQFFNAFLPGSTGGDLVKIVQVCRWYPSKKSSGVASIFLDRMSALLALLIFVGFSLLRQPIPCAGFGISQAQGWGIIFGAGMLGIVALAFLLRRFAGLRAKVTHVLAAAKTALASRTSLSAGIALAFAIHLLNFLFFFLSAHAIGLVVSFGQVLLICPVVLLLSMLPLSVNGHGIREVLLISYLGSLNIPAPGGLAESVVGLSIIMLSMDFLWSLPGGLFYLFGFNRLRTRC